MRGARPAVTEPGVAAGAASPTLSRVSRYPTRTAPAVPGPVGSRPWRLTAASGPPSCARTAFVVALRTPKERPDRSEIVPRLIQLIESRPRWAR